MSSTVLRLGLWIIILVLGAYVLHESMDEQVAELIPMPLLTKALTLGGVLVVAGIVLRLFEKSTKVVSKNRCAVCRTPIAHGAIYCREHLRNVLTTEDERLHQTKIRRS